MNELGENDVGIGAADYWFVFGDAGDAPVGGDWDGNGIDEVGLHRETTGLFYWRNSLTTGTAEGKMFFGDPGDRFVAADWGIIDGRDYSGGIPADRPDKLLPSHDEPGKRRFPVRMGRCNAELDTGCWLTRTQRLNDFAGPFFPIA